MAALAAEKLAESKSPAPPESREVRRNDPAVEAAFQAVPADMVAEIINGQLHTMPRPGFRHAIAGTRLSAALTGPFWDGDGGPGGWVILIEPEIHLGTGPDKVAPDLAGWRAGRLPDLPDDEDIPHFEVAPDWICEILSPSTAVKDRVKKMELYRRERIPHVWLLHPVDRILEVYRLHDGLWLQIGSHEGDEVVRAEPFDAIELDLKTLWGPRRAAG